MVHVGDNIRVPETGWEFGGDTAASFDAHVRRSVPLYAAGLDLACRLSDFFLRENSRMYDLGTATGELLLRLSLHSRRPGLRIIGIDSEPDMIARAAAKCGHDQRIALVTSDLAAFEFESCDFAVCAYTLQFLPMADRVGILTRLAKALNPGGALFILEKVRAPDARTEEIETALYQDFKVDQGFTGDEIIAKAKSLRGLLLPASQSENEQMLMKAGFSRVETVLKYLMFQGFLAIKASESV